MQVTLDTLTEDHDALRAATLRPKLEESLNQQQIQAFRFQDGPALVLAGAGSGKTTVLTRRVARLLTEGVRADRIFVATFTKKAADEMTERLVGLLGEGGPAIVEKLWIGTFHSHCLRVLKAEWSHLYGKAGHFQIADEHWQLRVAKAILGDKDWNARGLPSPPFGLNIFYDPKSALSIVSACKNRGADVTAAEQAIRDHAPTLPETSVNTIAKFWRCYEQAKEAQFDLLTKKPSRRLDFDDLLIETLKLLQENPSIRAKYADHFHYILIDETQDTSAVQWEIARLIAADRKNIFIVGDIGQAIYSFRGADPRSTIAQFTGAYPTGEIIRLPTNYRSTATIVRIANELIACSDMDTRFRLEMAPALPDGDAPLIVQHDDAEAEGKWVAETLKAYWDEGGILRESAVLMRTNAYSRAMEEAFVTAGIPYRLEGAQGFYGRKEVRELLAFLHLSVERDSPAADEACKRVLNVASKTFGKPTHFLGGAFINGVATQAARKKVSFYRALLDAQFTTAQGLAVRDFRDMVKAVAMAGDSAEGRLRKAREMGYDDYLLREEGHVEEEGNSRLDNLEELCVSAAAFPSAKDYLNFVLAQQTKAGEEPTGDYIEMMTVHRSKGLEWPSVYVVGFAAGMIPHHRSMRFFDEEKTQLIPDSVEEERRLAYVAITRAKQHVILSWPRQHQSRTLTRSPFLSEMPSLGEIIFEDRTEAAEDA
ncbi:MAG TPA: ATP-dependent helicase [Capsulimonadaceae bacterium]|jgi:DNA helicase-2/ATP-dependent DNA helicase PcrA